MAIEFKLPELGENIESADIVKILVAEGDQIKIDQILFEIETDKATVEVPSDVEGVINKILVEEGTNAKVGDVLFFIETGTVSKPAEPAQPVQRAEPAQAEKTLEEPVKKEMPQREAATQVTKNESPKIKSNKIAPAAPSVRRFAREIGIDIHQVTGSGPGGRISVDDVKLFAKSINEGRSQAPVSSGIAYEPLPDFSKWGEVDHQIMSNIRKKTAQHLSSAWSTIPHVTQFDKADITELEKLRKEFGKKAEAMGGKLTVTAILLKIVASALKVFPQFNSSLDMEKNEVIYKKYYNIGVAVDTEWGLLVPVIKGVDKKNIIQLAVELNEMSVKAKSKKLAIEEMQGGAFTISNLGGIGGTYFTPIVNSPEVAILGVSRASFEPIYKGGQFEPGLMMPLSLSYDHRIIDGADAIRFLRWIVNALEEPFLLSLEG